jgi:Calcineurin-like phosphoesterase
MPDIRYVCLSDMHLGAETSLLTNLKVAQSEVEPLSPSPVLEKLVECLQYLIAQNEDKSKKPTLVLNGDILEFALAAEHNAAMTFERFIDLTMDQGKELFAEIIYNPGNHDHHLWESARETQYVNHITSTMPWGAELPYPWHVTNIFTDPVPAYFLTSLVQRRPNLSSMTIQTAYPNYGLLSQDRTKCVIFHHGQFIESIYLLMSILKTMLFPSSEIPPEIWGIEKENFAWIDFFWSALGRSGDLGKGVGRVYEKLKDQTQVRKLLANLAAGLAARYDLPGWGDRMEAKLLEVAFDVAADGIGRLERNKPETILSEDAEKGLWAYMDGPLWQQLSAEWQRVTGESDASKLAKTTFIFGHTHKPFQENMNFAHYSGWVDVYNSGGWVVDTVNSQPLHGGAIILVDENLEATSLRMYNESDDPDRNRVSVQEARHPGDQPGDFHSRIAQLVDASPSLWQAFSDTVARAVNVRAQNLRARINSPIY